MQKKAMGILLGIGMLAVACSKNQVARLAELTLLPRAAYGQVVSQGRKSWLSAVMPSWMPFLQYAAERDADVTKVEDTFTSRLLAMQKSTGAQEAEHVAERVDADKVRATLPVEKLRNVSYLVSKYYIVDSTTTIKKSQMDVDKFLAKDMRINTETEGPKVLIFHTHSQETFKDSKKGDTKTSIVGIGAYLAEKLNEKGIETLHHSGVYDLVNGKLDRSKAYDLSEVGVRKLLKENPSIEVVIDLHRDGVPEGTHLVTEVDGKQVGKIMFFNGLSRTKTNGDIDYLYNPYIEDNLAFSFQMQLASEAMYPGFSRKIYLKGYRYSLHMMPKSLLIEAGAQTNTVEEMKNAMDLLSNILYEVLKK